MRQFGSYFMCLSKHKHGGMKVAYSFHLVGVLVGLLELESSFLGDFLRETLGSSAALFI